MQRLLTAVVTCLSLSIVNRGVRVEVVRLWIDVRGYHRGFIYTSSCDVMLLKLATDETIPGPLQLAAILETASYVVFLSCVLITETTLKNRWKRGGHVRLTKQYNQLTAGVSSNYCR